MLLTRRSALSLLPSLPVARRLFAQRQSAPYTICGSFEEVLQINDARYLPLTRVSDPEAGGRGTRTGFFFYQCHQFDRTGRYLLGMRLRFEGRAVQPEDRAEVGLFDRRRNFRWTQFGETTAWNWQQGARLQWRPGSDEIVWNDRTPDGKGFLCQVHNFRTGKRRTLPRPIYAMSPDGTTALTHDFERMKHPGTDYVGIEDPYKGQLAPEGTGVWKVNMNSGRADLIIPLSAMARAAYPKGLPASGHLYFFREGWNPSGTRFIVFIKDPPNGLFEGFSAAADGSDIRYLYHNPSHHAWRDDRHVMDFGSHVPPQGSTEQRGFYLFSDDGSGKARQLLWSSDFDGHSSYLLGSGGDWIVSDTYNLQGFQHLFLFHVPTGSFVPVARLKSTAGTGIFRVDLHPRISPDGRTLCIDATHEGVGRQMYVVDIGRVVDNPPTRSASR